MRDVLVKYTLGCRCTGGATSGGFCCCPRRSACSVEVHRSKCWQQVLEEGRTCRYQKKGSSLTAEAQGGIGGGVRGSWMACTGAGSRHAGALRCQWRGLRLRNSEPGYPGNPAQGALQRQGHGVLEYQAADSACQSTGSTRASAAPPRVGKGAPHHLRAGRQPAQQGLPC
jgi:hypothetical protein